MSSKFILYISKPSDIPTYYPEIFINNKDADFLHISSSNLNLSNSSFKFYNINPDKYDHIYVIAEGCELYFPSLFILDYYRKSTLISIDGKFPLATSNDLGVKTQLYNFIHFCYGGNISQEELICFTNRNFSIYGQENVKCEKSFNELLNFCEKFNHSLFLSERLYICQNKLPALKYIINNLHILDKLDKKTNTTLTVVHNFSSSPHGQFVVTEFEKVCIFSVPVRWNLNNKKFERVEYILNTFSGIFADNLALDRYIIKDYLNFTLDGGNKYTFNLNSISQRFKEIMKIYRSFSINLDYEGIYLCKKLAEIEFMNFKNNIAYDDMCPPLVIKQYLIMKFCLENLDIVAKHGYWHILRKFFPRNKGFESFFKIKKRDFLRQLVILLDKRMRILKNREIS